MQCFEGRGRGSTGTGTQVCGGATTTLVAAVVWYFVGTSFVEVESTSVAFESLSHESEQHLAAEVAESGRFVRVDLQRVRPDVDLV